MRTATTRSEISASSTSARPIAVTETPAARIVSAHRGSSRSRASDSRRLASTNTIVRSSARTIVETGIACGSPPPVESVATVPSGHSGSVSDTLQQADRRLELLVRGRVDGLDAGLAVHARVDRAVRLARPPRDRGDQRVALGAQALAALECALRLGGRSGG